MPCVYLSNRRAWELFQEASFDGEQFGTAVDRILGRWLREGLADEPDLATLRGKALYVRSEVSAYFDRKHDKTDT